MAHHLFPGAAAQGYEPVRQEDPQHAGQPVDEKALPYDWQADVAAARRRLRRRRILFGAAAVTMLLAPLALMSILGRPHYFDRYRQPGYGPAWPEVSSLEDVAPGQMTPWLARLGGYESADDAFNNELSSSSSPPLQCSKHDVPWSGNGRYYVETEDLTQIELLVKAHYLDTKLTVTHAGDPEESEVHRVADDDEDDDADKLYIDAKVFFSHERLQDSIKLTQKRDQSHYSWQIDEARRPPHHDPPHHDPPHHGPPHHGPPHHGPPHHHHHSFLGRWWPGRRHDGHGKRPPCGRAHIHIHLPKHFTDLDSLYLGLAAGKIHTKGLEHIQFGRFKAGVFRGLVHVENINAVQLLEAGAIHGDVVLYRSQSQAVLVGAAAGKVHVTDVEAQKVVRARATSGDVIIARTKAPVIVAATVSGRAETSDSVEAARLIAGSVSGEVKLHGTVTRAVRARTVSGAIDAAFDYKPKHGGHDDDDEGDDDDEDYRLSLLREASERLVGGKRADINLAAVSGVIHLRLEDYVGHFLAQSAIGRVEVHGDKVHLTQDTDHRKVGYVDNGGDADDAPRIAANAISGDIALKFV